MSKTTAEINTELTFYQCCLADLAYKYIKKEESGAVDTDCLLYTLIYGTTLLESLKCSQVIITRAYLTQDELESELEKLSDICGCEACEDTSELTNDIL